MSAYYNITLSLQYIYDNIDDIDAHDDVNHVNVMSRNFQVFLSVERGDLGILKAIGIQDSQVLIILSPEMAQNGANISNTRWGT